MKELSEQDMAAIEARLAATPVDGTYYHYTGNLRRLLADDLPALLRALRASREQVRVLVRAVYELQIANNMLLSLDGDDRPVAGAQRIEWRTKQDQAERNLDIALAAAAAPSGPSTEKE